jgi:hypothetical protein
VSQVQREAARLPQNSPAAQEAGGEAEEVSKRRSKTENMIYGRMRSVALRVLPDENGKGGGWRVPINDAVEITSRLIKAIKLDIGKGRQRIIACK